MPDASCAAGSLRRRDGRQVPRARIGGDLDRVAVAGEGRELWTLGRHLYVMNSRTDLMTNVGRVIADGLLAQPSAARLKRSARV